MPHNQLKKYPELLEILHLSEHSRNTSLRRIFDRDITFNENFKFLKKQIRPVKKDGEANLATVFNHLTKKEIIEVDDEGNKIRRRVFESYRAHRLHWVKPHIAEEINDDIVVFSAEERDQRKRKNVYRTYIHNRTEKYVIILEPQNSGMDYYLLTAYHLNEKKGREQIRKKWKKRLNDIL